MSSREKNLISILLLAGFLMLNFFLYTQFKQKKTLFETNLETAQSKLQIAINEQASSDQYGEQMQWLADHEPTATDVQTVQGELQTYIDKEARSAGLELKGKQRFLPSNTQGQYYHRAQIEISVTGKEKDLYTWLQTINDPAAFRAATQILLRPNTHDDTLIDCTAVISQWFSAETTDS
jgi:hypothetical protein